MCNPDELIYRASLVVMTTGCLAGVAAICYGLAAGDASALGAGQEAVQTGLLVGVVGKVFREW